jgi:hypothetical protein
MGVSVDGTFTDLVALDEESLRSVWYFLSDLSWFKLVERPQNARCRTTRFFSRSRARLCRWRPWNHRRGDCSPDSRTSWVRPAGSARHEPRYAAAHRNYGTLAIHQAQRLERSPHGNFGDRVGNRHVLRSASFGPSARATPTKGVCNFLGALGDVHDLERVPQAFHAVRASMALCGFCRCMRRFLFRLLWCGRCDVHDSLVDASLRRLTSASARIGALVVLPAIVIAIPTYTLAGLSDWPTGLALGFGAVCTVGFGVALAHRLPEHVLRVALCVILYAGAAALWIHG